MTAMKTKGLKISRESENSHPAPQKGSPNLGELSLIFFFTAYFFFIGAEAVTFPKKAMYFPMTVAVAGTMAGIGLLIPRIRLLVKTKKSTGKFSEDSDYNQAISRRATLFAIISLWTYLGVSALLGYIIATILVSLVGCVFLGREIKFVKVITYTVILMILIYLIFEVLLQVKMPRPFWW